MSPGSWLEVIKQVSERLNKIGVVAEARDNHLKVFGQSILTTHGPSYSWWVQDRVPTPDPDTLVKTVTNTLDSALGAYLVVKSDLHLNHRDAPVIGDVLNGKKRVVLATVNESIPLYDLRTSLDLTRSATWPEIRNRCCQRLASASQLEVALQVRRWAWGKE